LTRVTVTLFFLLGVKLIIGNLTRFKHIIILVFLTRWFLCATVLICKRRRLPPGLFLVPGHAVRTENRLRALQTRWLRGCSTVGARSTQQENAAQGFLSLAARRPATATCSPPRYNRPISIRFDSSRTRKHQPNSTVSVAAAPPSPSPTARARPAMAPRKFFVGGNWKCVSAHLSIRIQPLVTPDLGLAWFDL
jgi:hypothetical protein